MALDTINTVNGSKNIHHPNRTIFGILLSGESLTVTNPSVEELDSVLQLAFQHLPDNERVARIAPLLEQCVSGVLSTDGIFQAKDREQRIGALFAQKRPDDTILSWTPTMQAGVSPQPLYEHLRQYAQRIHANSIVMLVDLSQKPDKRELDAAGYEYLSDLVYLVTTIDEQNPPEPPRQLRFMPFKQLEGNEQRFVDLVGATYYNSKDFPRLMETAAADKVLEGYRLGTTFRPDIWFIVQKGNEEVGVLLMTDYPDDQMELTYMGLRKEFRGQGLAGEIVRFARLTAYCNKRSLLLTAVDAQNTAPVTTYLAQGFHAWDRKKVFAAFL